MSEAQQTKNLKNKYGGLPSKKGILNKRMKGQTERTFFDSADHFSGKETGSQTKQPNLNSVAEESRKTDPNSDAGSSTPAAEATATAATGGGGGGGGSGTEATQAAKLSNKYGGLPSKKGILNKRMKGQNERTFFDSADHFSGKETGSQTKSLNHLKK